MISFETFRNAINYLKEKNKVDALLDDVIGGHNVVYQDGRWPIDRSSEVIVSLLEEAFHLPKSEYGTTLSWWIYDLNFGEEFEVGDIELVHEPDESPFKKPDIATLEQLYKFLIFEGQKN